MKFALLLLTLAASSAFAAPFEIKEGDRVLLLGDALLERENTYGLLEARMHEQFPNVKFTVRNLSWSGETPKGWSRASFDGPEKGWERLKEQIAEVKPTVAILGFGMAASLQEITDRSGDQTLNPDPIRYGAEPMSAARFKKELGELMDAINERTPDKQPARFVLLSPIKHEDLRKFRPGTPDPARHNALLEKYASAIKELAGERQTTFLNLAVDGGSLLDAPMTDNGISLSPQGYQRLSWDVQKNLGWDDSAKSTLRDRAKEAAIQAAILKKNDLFFHQFRPANSTYLFGFRKHEQGKNAAEMPKFTPLIETADAEIDWLKRATRSGEKKAAGTDTASVPPQATLDQVDSKATLRILPGPRYQLGTLQTDKLEDLKQPLAALHSRGHTSLRIEPDKTVSKETVKSAMTTGIAAGFIHTVIATSIDPLPLPNFTVAGGFELTLWADTDLVGKPVGMNWDAAGRLWVSCSPVYPQIEPGAHPHDKVVVLEDSDHDGKADKSTTFATNLLIAAGVAPDFGENGKAPLPKVTAAYVGSSTELIRAEDTNGDGIADKRRIVLSGFGTEDTHHTIHTLRWGSDGRLYFNQSIYIHSHMETPWGMVRLNSGGICAYDPHTERVEVFARGFINTWGHAWDKWGQSFATDGAGFEGVHWLVPGAMYRTYEGARRILPSISPGTYPKYCGLELIQSPLFPEDWQGNAITCDFRAHKITRFQINDLSQPTEPGKEPLSGYITKELPNPVVTTDASFRPIDVKLGPDGALYIADWTNPIINHGEVDFRDPRRDHTNGRIWRLAPKGKAPLKWESLTDGKIEGHFEKLTSASAWEQQAARHLVGTVLTRDQDHYAATAPFVDSPTLRAISVWEQKQSGQQQALAALRLLNSSGTGILTPLDGKQPFHELQKATSNADLQASIVRIAGDAYAKFIGLRRPDGLLNKTFRTAITSSAPRIRVEAMRALARIPTIESVTLILEAALNAPGGAAKQVRSEDKGTNQFNQPTFSDTADPYYGYAAWLSINELDDLFLKVLAEGTWKPDSTARQAQLAWALGALRPEKAGKGLSDFIAKNGLPRDGSGPWIELIGQAGGAVELGLLVQGLLANIAPHDPSKPLADKSLAFTTPEANRRAAAALVTAARRGLKPSLPFPGVQDLIASAPDEARADAIRLAGLWKMNVPDALVGHLQKKGAPAALRDAVFESLRALGTNEAAAYLAAFLDPRSGPTIESPVLRTALKQSDPATRRQALTALAAVRADAALGFLGAVLKEADVPGQLPLWRELFSSEPFTKALLKNVPQLTKEQAGPALRAARELGKRGEKLVAALTPLAGETPATPVAHDLAQLVDNTKKNGNPAEGELVYRRAALTCTVCHAIGGAGGKVGPDLSTIGASAPLDYIIESTVNPAAKVKEGFHAVAVTTKDGKTLSGTIAKETDTQITLRDMTAAEQVVEKSNVKERTNIGSLMPAGLVNALNHREQANLFAFMAQLGKPGPFDASKASIARTWRIYPGDQIEGVVANKPDPSKASVVHSFVDGRVTKDLLEVPLAIAGTSPTIVAATRFNTVSTAKTRLHLAGITKAWLDGAPLAIASDPNPVVDLQAGDHTLVIKLDTATLPAHFRAEAPEARFLTE